MEDDKKSKVRRYTLWGVFLVVVGGAASYLLPEHSLVHFFGLLKEIITNLIIGA